MSHEQAIQKATSQLEEWDSKLKSVEEMIRQTNETFATIFNDKFVDIFEKEDRFAKQFPITLPAATEIHQFSNNKFILYFSDGKFSMVEILGYAEDEDSMYIEEIRCCLPQSPYWTTWKNGSFVFSRDFDEFLDKISTNIIKYNLKLHYRIIKSRYYEIEAEISKRRKWIESIKCTMKFEENIKNE